MSVPTYTRLSETHYDLPLPIVIDGSHKAVKLVPDLADDERERVVVLLLDSSLQLIRAETLSIGTADSTVCEPRDVFRLAITHGATRIVLLHNHPSGMLDPSPADKALYKKLQKYGADINIHILDSIIVSARGFHSMALERNFT